MKNLLLSLVISINFMLPITSFSAVSCEDLSDLAESTMRNRQNNIPITTMKLIVNTSKDTSIQGIALSFIDYAYETPIHMSKERKKLAVAIFKKKMHLLCLETRQ